MLMDARCPRTLFADRADRQSAAKLESIVQPAASLVLIIVPSGQYLYPPGLLLVNIASLDCVAGGFGLRCQLRRSRGRLHAATR